MINSFRFIDISSKLTSASLDAIFVGGGLRSGGTVYGAVDGRRDAGSDDGREQNAEGGRDGTSGRHSSCRRRRRRGGGDRRTTRARRRRRRWCRGGGYRGPSVAPPLCRASLPSGVRYVRPTPPLAIRFSIPNEATNGFATTFIIYLFVFLLPKFFLQHESSDSNEKIWFL